MSTRLVALLVLAAGCVGSDQDDEGTVSDGKADGLSEFTLKLTRNSSGLLRAKESPKLPGAPSTSKTFACTIDDRTADGWRAICDRNKEQLQLTFGPTELAGAAIYKSSTDTPDKRSFYHCTATSMPADEWPAELTCSQRTPKGLINGQLVSPFSSSIDGVGIFNAHLVAEDPSGAKLFRGMKPFRPSDFEDLESLNIGAVLIFKKPTASTEVPKEITALGLIGVIDTNIVNVQFPFKDFTEFAEPCRMTIRSLKQLRTWTSAGTNAFLHCTVGEDRTGYLAGLYRLLTDSTAEVETIFETELCERGYSSGNPQKPNAGVVNDIDADLTPLFLKMAFKIQNHELDTLDEAVCDVDPAADPAFADPKWDTEAFRCRVSTRYRL
jgi:hypothetical protein